MGRCWFVYVFLLGAVVGAQAVTVDGTVYLYDRTDHSGSRALFEAADEWAVTDSAFTDASGRFSINLGAGDYRVYYANSDFASFYAGFRHFASETSLPVDTLLWPLSGHLTQSIIEPGQYQLDDSAWINGDESLSLRPGVIVRGTPRGRLVINGGYLNSRGRDADSVIFTRRYAEPDSFWGGIYILNTPTAGAWFVSTVIEYASGGQSVQPDWPHPGGGGVRSINSKIYFQCSAIRFNDAGPNPGGGVYFGGNVYPFNHFQPIFENSVVAYNRSGDRGGGVCSDPDTSAWWWMVGTLFLDNQAQNGGAIACGQARTERSDQHTYIERCIFRNNSADGNGGGLYSESFADVVACTFVSNSAAGHCGGIYNNHTWPEYYNALFVNSTIIAYGPSGEAVASVEGGDTTQISYSLFYQNNDGDFANGNGCPTRLNANGDSCDARFNLYLDPRFEDAEPPNYHLADHSPCIDAGDTSLSHDPDSTIADIGAFYYPHEVNVDGDFILPPSSFILSAYPNPFNATTRIAFELPTAGKAQLTVFDITGREVRTLVDGNVSAGRHEMVLDGSDLSSGVYFCRMTSASLTRTSKIVLLK